MLVSPGLPRWAFKTTCVRPISPGSNASFATQQYWRPYLTKDFRGDDTIPPYVILSHTWEDGEVAAGSESEA